MDSLSGLVSEQTKLPWPIVQIIKDFHLPSILDGTNSVVLAISTVSQFSSLYICSSNSTISQVCIETGELLQSCISHTSPPRCLALSPNNQHLFSGCNDGLIYRWPLDGLGYMYNINGSFKGHTSHVLCLLVSPDNRYLYSGSTDMTIRQWAVGNENTKQYVQSFKGHTSGISSLVLSSNGQYLYSASHDCSIRQWYVGSSEPTVPHQPVRTFTGHTGPVSSLVLSPDDNTLYSGSFDHTIRQWSVQTVQSERILDGHVGRIFGLAISCRGKYLYSGSTDLTIRKWTLDNPLDPVVFQTIHPVYFLGCTPKSLVYSQDTQIHQMLTCSYVDQSIQ